MTGINKTIWQYLLATDGVNQPLRVQPALDPVNVKIDDRSMSELLRFVRHLAQQIRYYGNNNLPQGDWQAFFDQLRDGATVLNDAKIQTLLAVKKDLSPHLALLLAYLQVYAVVQNDLNSLTKKRLDYYYQEVLRLQRTSPQPDEVHVVFEPGKNAQPTLVKAGSLLDAGKTTTGLPLQYALENDIVINQAIVGMLRSSFTEFKSAGKPRTFRATDATTVLNETATAWRPFGTSQLALPAETRSMEQVQFGWAVASPNLLLAEGKRTVKLIMALQSAKGPQPPKTLFSSMVDVNITTEKEWLSTGLTVTAELKPAVQNPDPDTENPYKLEVTIDINETLPAVTPYNEEVHLAAFPTQWPVVRVLLKPESDIATLLAAFRVENITIEVGAKGVRKLVLQNDQSVQPSDKPSLPFGNSPLVQSNFYIGSQEVFSKTLTSIAVNLEWQDAPESFVTHYANYGNNNIANNSFATAIDLLNNRNWNVRLVNNDSLFNLANTAQVKQINVDAPSFATQTVNAPFKRSPGLVLPESFDNTVNQGFMRLVLIGPTKASLGNEPEEAPFEAFGHKTYPFIYTQQVLALSKYENVGIKPELPKQPYTPVLKSITVDYTAKDVFTPNAPNTIDQYFMQDIFGPAETGKDDTALLVAPQPGHGALYIGLQNALAPQTLSFLFQIEEGSVEGPELLKTTDLQWSYLAAHHWRDISAADVLEESTGGVQKPGIIRLNIGSDATDQHSLMPSGMRWVRVSVKDNPLGAASVSGILAQAARAKLILPNGLVTGYEEHLAAPLPAQKITKMVVKVPAIKKVNQPYPSFGGRNIESDNGFYRRVSERLRHKNRAVSGWDYERLVLEYFPEIYKIKCLPHSGPDNSFSAGDLRLVVVPDWRKRPTGDPLQPRVNQNRLREIAQFVSNKFVSPFANVHVSNPSYETLLVDCRVNFHPQFDPGFYTLVLEEDIKKFLSPWAYEEGRDIVFGGKVHASEILAFIEGREYVEYVTDFELYHRHEGHAGGGISDMEINFDFIVGDTPEASVAESIGSTGGKAINIDFVVGVPVEVAAATRPDTILVSNSAHRIQALQANSTNCQGIQNIGIGQMIIGLDFVPIS
jgi:hypothetical protein